ncbi:hypothetical protein BV22DRAFT_1019554, partial [Leucogyrophana mollusca]
MQPESSTQQDEIGVDGKKYRIDWDKKNSPRTARLIEWCKANEAHRIALFSDSTKDAKDAGRDKRTPQKTKVYYYQLIAQAVFAEDEDSNIKLAYKNKPEAFSKPIATRLATLKRKYKKFNANLKKTGVGRMTVDDLMNDPETKTLIGKWISLKFPWWTDLHGWWRDIPTYNAVAATADPGQNFASEAI